MVDASRTPRRRPQGVSASPIQIAGVDGFGRLPTVGQPIAPSVSIPDRTAEFLAQSQQSVQEAFDINQQVIESNMRADMAEARSSVVSRNSFGNSLAGALGAASAIFTQVRDRQELSNAAQLEQDAQEFLLQFYTDVRENGFNEGVISTNAATLRELRKQYAGRVAPEVLSQISGLGYQALIEAQAQQGQRRANELEDARNFKLDQELQLMATDAVSQIINISRTDPLALRDPVRRNDVYNGIITAQLDARGLKGTDKIRAEAFLRNQVNAAMREQGSAIEEQEQSASNWDFILNEAERIQIQFANDPTRFRQQMLGLQVIADRLEVAINLEETFLGPVEASQEMRDYRENMNALNQAQGSPSSVSHSAQYSRAREVETVAVAVSLLNNPTQAANFRAEVEVKDNPTSAEVSALNQLDTLQEHTKVIQDNRIRLNEIRADRAATETRLQTTLDRADPQNRLNIDISTEGGVRVLIDLLSQYRDTGVISQETATAIENEVADIQRTLNEEERQIRNETNRIVGFYRDNFGWDINNPMDTSRLQEQREVVQPYLQEARRTGPQQIGPSGFHWGLP